MDYSFRKHIKGEYRLLELIVYYGIFLLAIIFIGIIPIINNYIAHRSLNLLMLMINIVMFVSSFSFLVMILIKVYTVKNIINNGMEVNAKIEKCIPAKKFILFSKKIGITVTFTYSIKDKIYAQEYYIDKNKHTIEYFESFTKTAQEKKILISSKDPRKIVIREMFSVDENRSIIYKKKIVIAFGLAIFCIIYLISFIYPRVWIGDKRIRIFVPSRIEQIASFIGIEPINNSFSGRVLNDYILETNLGKIKLQRSARIPVRRLFTDRLTVGITGISAEDFCSELVSHTLVFEENILPQNISVSFDHWNKITAIRDLGYKITISGIPLIIESIIFDVRMMSRSIHAPDANMRMIIIEAPETIVLMDSTKIYLTGTVFYYRNAETWVLTDSLNGTIYAILHGESEAVRYASIEFGKDWGDFIIGETHEIAEERSKNWRTR